MPHDICIRITDAQFEALKAERVRTLVPTSAFIRKAIEDALNPTGHELHIRAAVARGELKP